MQGDPVTRPYADLPIEEVTIRGICTANMLLVEEDPYRSAMRQRQRDDLRKEYRIKLNAKKAGDGQ